MTNRSQTASTAPHVSRPLSDEESTVRERTPAPGGSPRAPGSSRQSDSDFTLTQRLERKLAEAGALLARLEPQDARARLLHIAMLRRDETLLDGIVAELSLPPQPTRRSR